MAALEATEKVRVFANPTGAIKRLRCDQRFFEGTGAGPERKSNSKPKAPSLRRRVGSRVLPRERKRESDLLHSPSKGIL